MDYNGIHIIQTGLRLRLLIPIDPDIWHSTQTHMLISGMIITVQFQKERQGRGDQNFQKPGPLEQQPLF